MIRPGEVFRERDVRILLGAQFAAQAADGFAQAAFANALILEPLHQSTPERILALFALTLVPYSIIAPFLGVFVDRWSRRALLAGSNVVRGTLLVALPLWAPLFLGDNDLFVAVLAMLGLGRLFLTTKGALLPVVLHERHLLRGNALSGGGGMISALVGGVAGVGAVGVLGVEPAFFVAGLAYLASAGVARLLSQPFTHAAPHEESVVSGIARIARELIDGLRAVSIRPGARLPLAAIFVLRTIGMTVAIAAILVIKNQFPEAGDRFGRLSSSALALGSAGAGAVAGALAAPTLGKRLNKPGLIVLGFIVSGVGIAALGGLISIPAVMALTFVGGFGGFTTKVAVDASLQEALPDHYRGRAFSLYDILYNLASVAAALVMVTIQGSTLRPALMVMGLLTLVLAAFLTGPLRRAAATAAAPS